MPAVPRSRGAKLGFLVFESLAADQTAGQDGRIEQDENCNTGTASHAHADMVRSEVILSILSILSRCSIVLAELPGVGPERRYRQPLAIVECRRDGAVRPQIPNRDRPRNAIAPDDDTVLFDLRVRPDELMVVARNGESCQRSITGARHETATDVLEFDDHSAIASRVSAIRRSGGRDVLAV